MAEDRLVVVGLGNPGREYAATRHNAGFRALDVLADRHGIRITTRRFGALLGQGMLAGRPALLVLPQTFMNRSGEAVASVAGYYRAAPGDLIVVHDDVDLTFGRVKVKQGGGTGGHRGLDSIVERLGAADFARVRVGIGRPAPEWDTTDWVLSRFAPEEQEAVPALLERAADAVEAIAATGIVGAMNRFNARHRPDEPKDAEPG